MKILGSILVILSTIVNLLRYNLPVYWDKISIFDTLSLVALLLICIVAYISKKNVLTEGFLIFNIVGCLESIADELFFDPTAMTDADMKILFGTTIFCILFMIYRVFINKKDFL